MCALAEVFSPFGCLSIGTVEFPAGQALAWEMLCLLPALASFLPCYILHVCVEARRRRCRRMQRVAATPTLAVPAAQRRGETSVQCAVNCFMTATTAAAAASSCFGSAASVGMCHI